MRSTHSSSEQNNSFDEKSSGSDAYIPDDDEDGEFGIFKSAVKASSTPMTLRHSNRNIGHSISYNELDEDSDKGSEDELDPILGNGRIDHIYISRKTNGSLEYLVDFQEATDPFAHWFQSDQLLNQSSNFKRILQKFNETEMKIKCYDTKEQDSVFDSSYLSSMHIISHRPMNNDINSDSLEFLYQFNLETGNPYVWEPNTADAPRKLIQKYMETRVCVTNTHPKRPKNLDISYESKTEFKSVDGFSPKDYQVDGVNWMLQCFCANHGCILADEMGLGKTIQCLVFLMRLNRASSFHGPYLVAVRTNTFTQWCSEIERWSDLKYISYSGPKENREMIRDYQIPYFDDKGNKVEGKYGFNILLVTYEIFLKDVEYFKKIDWQIIFLDEGHRVKNVEGKKHNALQSIPSMHRIILTGTPIQSTLLELWTLLNFVSPDFFVDNQMFPEDDVESLDDDVLNELRSLITPHLMRRSLIDVEKSIIPKDERVVFLQLTKEQKELTRLTKMHELWRVKDGSIDTHNEPNLLHRICNHPFLIDGTREYYQSHRKLTKLQLLVNFSAKFIFLNKILPIFKKQGRSVLIFSQRLKILNLLSEYCTLKKYSHEMLIGSLTETEKKEAISRFTDKKKDVFIFLISTRSGSEGLNLTKASITIIFDPDWNPQNDLQAQGRCHRIGQTQKVDVIRLLTYGTYEHEMFARAQRKLKLWDMLLGEGKTTDPALAKKAELKKNPDLSSLANRNFNGNLMGNSSHRDLIELEGVIPKDMIKETKEINEEVANTTEVEPPPQLTTDADSSLTFEEVLEKSATVVNDIQLIAQQSRHFPELDLSFGGLSDEDFLKKFTVDPSVSASYDKKKSRMTDNVPRVQLDPKSAKRLIKFLEIHGYGKWEEIHQSVKEICPIEQVERFCQAATILHFRAINWTRISSFPLLLKQLQNDVPKFELSFVMNNDRAEWYSIFSKRSIFAGESTNVCKLISNHIHKTALSFLAHLEHHLLVSEWQQENEDFPFDQLPIDNKRSREADEELFSYLVDGTPMKLDQNEEEQSDRTAQIFTLMKSQLLLRNEAEVDTFIIPFWTKGEVLTLFSSFRNYGETILTLPLKVMKSKTTIMSKKDTDIERFAKCCWKMLSTRHPTNHDPLIIPSELTMIAENAPERFTEDDTIVIELPEVLATIKRILLIRLIHSALKNIAMKNPDRSKIMPSGQGWFTMEHCVSLLKLLVEKGMDNLVGILLSPSYSFHEHFNENDKKYLEKFNKSDLKEDSKLPSFLINENKFYMFLKALAGKNQQNNQSNRNGQTIANNNNNNNPANNNNNSPKMAANLMNVRNNNIRNPNLNLNRGIDYTNMSRKDIIHSVYGNNLISSSKNQNMNMISQTQIHKGSPNRIPNSNNNGNTMIQKHVLMMMKENPQDIVKKKKNGS